MKKLNILLATLFVFFVYQNLVLAKSECEEILSSEMPLKMTVGIGKMYFNGYNYAKKTNIKYLARKSISCLLYTSPSPRAGLLARMPSSAG